MQCYDKIDTFIIGVKQNEAFVHFLSTLFEITRPRHVKPSNPVVVLNETKKTLGKVSNFILKFYKFHHYVLC